MVIPRDWSLLFRVKQIFTGKGIWWTIIYSCFRGRRSDVAITGFCVDSTSRRLDTKASAWHNQQMACAPSKDSNQPRHLLNLIFADRMKKAWVLSYLLSAQRKLSCRCWSESSLGAQAILLVLSCTGSQVLRGPESSLGAQAILLVLSCAGSRLKGTRYFW